MPNDIADWTQAVVVQSGTITISGTPTVAISGTPTVNIAPAQSIAITGTVTVSVGNTPSVTISGTPAVTISGTPTVNIAAAQSIGISGTVTIAGAVTISSGTVNIGNTPAVTISGTPTVNIAAAQSIGISGTVTIAGAVTISSGTVNIGNTPAVTISGTPNITVTSGTINVQTAGGISLNTVTPSVQIGSYTASAGVFLSAAFTIPAGAIAVLVQWPASATLSAAGNFKLTGQQTGTDYFNEPVNTSPAGITGILPAGFDGFIAYVSPYDTTFKVTTVFTGTPTVYLSGILVPITPSVEQVVGIGGAQPMPVEESSNVTVFMLNNSVSANADLNITASAWYGRSLQFNVSNATTGIGLADCYFETFGISPQWIFRQTVFCAASQPTQDFEVDLHRMYFNSGFKAHNGSGGNMTFRGTVLVDSDL